jgi:hypothetical protein
MLMMKDVKKTDTDKKKQKAEPDKVNTHLHISIKIKIKIEIINCFLDFTINCIFKKSSQYCL